MTSKFYDFTLTRRGRAEGVNPFTDALDLADVEPARARLHLLLSAAVVRANGNLRDLGEYALQVREHRGSDLVMTFATFGEVQR